jgi:hypothetical protein
MVEEVGKRQRWTLLSLSCADEALEQFRGSAGWEAGVDVNVALHDIGDL